MNEYLQPDRNGFDRDPFGYSALAWHKWGLAQTMAGFPVDLERPPTSEDLKSPILWMAQAQALCTAAVNVLTADPKFEEMPVLVRGMCHSQYCAVGLMLVGYSLEICLKAMTIIQLGVEEYSKAEKSMKHHQLVRLAEFVPDLSEKDTAILRLLTHFVYWAGRYPEPGSGRDGDANEIFQLSEHHEISARQLFQFASRIMRHAQTVTEAM